VGTGPDKTVEKDSPVEFTGSGGGTPADLPVLNYSWSFGDGNSSAWSPDPNATHIYTRSGNYTAVLSVRDDEGTVATASLKVAVSNRPPLARILAPAPSAAFDKDREVQFAGSAADTESLDLARQQGGVLTIQAALLPLELQERQTLFALAILLGRAPEGFDAAATAVTGLTVPRVAPGLCAATFDAALEPGDKVT
jgi:outer membrane protein TolC